MPNSQGATAMRVSSKEVKYPHYSREILMKLEFSEEILEKSSNIKFNENPASNSRVVLCRRPDTHTDEANNGFSQFCASA